MKLLLLGILSWTAVWGAAPQTIRIAGTGSSIAMMHQMGVAYSKISSQVKFETPPSLGTSGAIKGVNEGAFDLAAAGRKLREFEKVPGLKEIFLGQTPFVFLAHETVSEKNINEEELVKILEGKKEKWTDGRPIRIILRPLADADSELIMRVSPALERAYRIAVERPGMTMATSSNQEVLEKIQKSSGSVGFSSLAQIRGEKPLQTKILKWNGTEATLANLKNKSYPLKKEIYLVYREENEAKLKGFLDFLKSKKAQSQLMELGFLAPLN